jgi:NAD(P)-dependent dehydrogenase (short-subunit alcohol dehydrogenase family)
MARAVITGGSRGLGLECAKALHGLVPGDNELKLWILTGDRSEDRFNGLSLLGA